MKKQRKIKKKWKQRSTDIYVDRSEKLEEKQRKLRELGKQ